MSEKKVKVIKHDFDDEVEDFLAHYGVLGMKWGVRKDQSGKLRQKTTMTPDQRKKPNNALAEGVDQSVMDRNNRIMDKSSPGMKKQIKILNNRPEYKNSDLTKDPVLRKKYNKEMSTAIASVYLKNSMALKHPNEVLILKLHPDVITDGRETMDFYISETSGMFHETVSPDGLIEFKDVAFDYDKSVKHSDSPEVIVGSGTISLEYNALGHIIDVTPPTKLSHSDDVDDFLAHYGVLGMKWGVRKDRRGKIRARSTMNRRDKKDNLTIATPQNENFNKVYSRVYKHAASKIRGSIRAINKRPEYQKQDFRTDSPLRRKYYEEISKAVSTQLNASSAFKGRTDGKRFEMVFDYDVTKGAQPTATFRQVDKRKGSKDQRKAARETRNLSNLRSEIRSDRKAAKESSKLKHSDDSDNLDVVFDKMGYVLDVKPNSSTVTHSDDVDDFLAHYGVLGMKWGIRKDPRTGKRRPTKQVLADQKRRSKKEEAGSRKSNRLSDNPQNRSISDEELRKVIGRIKLEKQYAELTAKQTAPPSRVKTLVKDVAYDVVKGATTEAGKTILAQAIKVQYNKRAKGDYKVPLKVLNEIKDKVSN